MNTVTVTLFKSKLSNEGEPKTTSWADFAQQFKHQVGPKDGLAFTCGTFVGNHRKAQNAQMRTLVVLEI